MQKDIGRETAEHLARRHRRRTWKKAVSVLACVVIFCTTYALILPAITMEKKSQCGKIEHIHSEDCYTQITTESKTVPVCTLEGLKLHDHTDTCLDENGEYCCGYSDFVVHEHADSCLDEDGNLWCPLPEVKAHTHSEKCYAKTETKPKHSHTDKCYAAERGKLICTTSEGTGAHTHSIEAGCYDENGELICKVEETTGHKHTDDCYDWDKVLNCKLSNESSEKSSEPLLICDKAEIVLHEHTSDCYDEDDNLICGKQQVLEHVHSRACFQTVEQPVDTEIMTCTIAEGEGAHIHSEEAGCYDKNKKLICEQEESGGHHHGSRCYGTWELTCNLEEHTHSPECLDDSPADSTADLETADIWEKSLPETIPERWAEAVLEVAKSQLGYRESSKNYIEDEEGKKKGYTRYGEWYGDPYGDWCAMFVSFCLNYADIPDEAIPREAACDRWVEALQKEECDLYRAKESYEPKIGDLIFFDRDGDEKADHVGLVAELLEATKTETAQLRTIEGNSDNCVQYVDYQMDEATIFGYGELPEEPRVEYRWSEGGMEVVASVKESDDLPENASLTVQPLSPEDEKSVYTEKYAESQEKLAAEDSTEISQFDLFKVYLEADGKEVLPEKEATVEVRLQEEYPVLPHTELYHYSEDGAVTPDPNMYEESGELIGSFDTELSGEYAVVGAADSARSKLSARAADAPEGGIITPHKTIDAFRDGKDNPDTTLDDTQNIDKTDLYRLYLDAELRGNQVPIDLLIVVDQSGSMHMNYKATSYNNWTNQWDYEIMPDEDPGCVRDMTDEAGNPIYRDQAVRLVLNGAYEEGQYEQKKQNGLIEQFLNANSENNVAVVGFQGRAYDGKNNYSYNEDASPILGWTNKAQYVNVEGKVMNGTNYSAGLLQAMETLSDPAIKDNGHKKVMLFLSDGYPTFNLVSRTVWGTTRYYRYGNGNQMDDDTRDRSKGFFDDLRKQYPDLVTYTIGISEDITGTGDQHSDVVLKYMADQSGGTYTGVNSTKELSDALKKKMFGTVYSDLVIQDTLSEYVDLHKDQPDFKVVMKNADGTETVLYTDGKVTTAGSGILKDVTYDSDTKKVSTVFEPAFTPKPGSTYTLSFNVKTNRDAYQEYAKNGYGDVTGDAGTDYTGNSTSSGKAGFHSNALAQVTYKKDGVEASKEYPHPVVQAVDCKVAIQKTDSKDESKKLSGAEFTLYRKAFAEETGETLEGQDGSYVKISEKLTTDTDGQLIITNLVPGDYCLVETKAPLGYMEPTAPVPFTLSRKTDGNGQIEGSDLTITVDEEILPALQVTNVPWGRELPMTGGAGTTPYTLGGLLLVATAGAFLLYKKKKHGKEVLASF